MLNPWLDIPLEDYEGHMVLPHVAQAQLLGDIFESLLLTYRPSAVAVLGCAGGNGFERISPGVTPRVVGVDCNPNYVSQTRARFAGRFRSLQVLTADLVRDRLDFEPVDLIYAALVFEYLDPGDLWPRLPVVLNPDGVVGVVLQLPASATPAITPSPFGSLKSLAAVMRLVPPDDLTRLAEQSGFRQVASEIRRSPAGKEFQLHLFKNR